MSKQSKRDRTKDLAEELDVLDTMLSALVETLKEKGITT
jgi:biotin operon repressor